MGDVRKLIEAVERGEFHRKDGPAKYSALYQALGGPCAPPPEWHDIARAMKEGPAATAAILRAMEGR